jgi:hypothetical protein
MSASVMKSIQTRKKSNDVVYTPQKIVDIMVDDIDENMSILDPCSGKGIFYDSFKNIDKYKCEIEEGTDFFEFNTEVELIYGNPPYSILNKWLEHSFKIATKKIKYIIGMYSLTPVRIDLAKKYGWNITSLILTQVPSWFQRSYIISFEKKECNNIINFKSINLGNRCLYCDCPCGGMRGQNIKHCKRKMNDDKCSY